MPPCVDGGTADAPSDAKSDSGEEPPLFTGDPLGYNQARRDCAKKLGVDLARASEHKLQQMGVPGDAVRAFLHNRWFTPTLQTALVAALEKLRGVSGGDAVIGVASRVSGEVPARFLIRSLLLLAERQKGGGGIAMIRMRGTMNAAVNAAPHAATAMFGMLLASAAWAQTEAWQFEATPYLWAAGMSGRDRIVGDVHTMPTQQACTLAATWRAHPVFDRRTLVAGGVCRRGCGGFGLHRARHCGPATCRLPGHDREVRLSIPRDRLPSRRFPPRHRDGWPICGRGRAVLA